MAAAAIFPSTVAIIPNVEARERFRVPIPKDESGCNGCPPRQVRAEGATPKVFASRQAGLSNQEPQENDGAMGWFAFVAALTGGGGPRTSRRS